MVTTSPDPNPSAASSHALPSLWSLRPASLPDSLQGRKVEYFQNWKCSPVSPRGCVAASHTSLLHLKMGAASEDAVGSSYHSHSAERDLPAVSGLCAAEARRCILLHSTSEMPETSVPIHGSWMRATPVDFLGRVTSSSRQRLQPGLSFESLLHPLPPPCCGRSSTFTSARVNSQAGRLDFY